MHFLKTLFARRNRGESREYRALVDAAVERLRFQTGVHAANWHFGEEQRWDFNQDRGVLVLTFADAVAEMTAQIIGTLDGRARTWKWAWANPSIAEPLKRDSRRVQRYGEQQGIGRLTEPTWSADEADAWRMTALALHLCESSGAYRGAGEGTDAFTFFTFDGKISLARRH